MRLYDSGFSRIQSQTRSRARRVLQAAGVLAPAALLWGCAGFVNGQNSQAPPPPQTYSLSGTISAAQGGNGATVTLSGGASATATANSSGAYTFTGLANGTYTITPTHAGFTFNPLSQSVTIGGSNVSGVNFTGTAQTGQTYSISGTISPAVGGSGATVTLSGAASASTTADGSGNYTFSGLNNGSYAITPSRTGYTFSPTSQNATVSGANVTGVNFTATVQTGQTYSISGTISPTAGGAGATMTLSGAASVNTTADGSGNYTFGNLANGTYTVTPSNTGYAFTPANQSVTVNGANVSAVNFTAAAQQHSAALSWTASTSTVSGYNVYRATVNGGPYSLLNTSLLTGLSYTDISVQSGATYYYVATAVDSNGVESVYATQVTAVIP